MRLAGIRSWPVRRGWRLMLVAEVLGYCAAASAYAFFALPVRAVQWYHVAFFVFAGGFPVAMNILHGDWLPDSGIRLDTMRASARETALATAAMVAGLAVLGVAVGGPHWVSWSRLGDKAALYLLWGPIQQYLLQAFALRRLMQAGLGGLAASVLAAGAFAMVHAPNWTLVAMTAGAGLVWCRLFLRHPNLLPLGLAHGVLAVLAYHLLPADWLANMTIGADYLRHVQ